MPATTKAYGVFTLSSTEFSAQERSAFDRTMRWRVRRWGQPCLTQQECRAVSLSLMGLPPDAYLEGERVTQKYVAAQMRVSQARVSQLLCSAAKAMLWLEAHGCDVGWVRKRRRGRRYWDFVAPCEDAQLQPLINSLPSSLIFRTIHGTLVLETVS